MKFLSIHVTDLCNSSCSFCVVSSPFYTEDSVRYESIIEFLKDNAGKGYEAVNLHGGEATIHPHFFDILTLIRDLGYPEVHLQTNAIRLANEKFTKRAVELGVTKFIISLHGHLAELQDSQTGTPGGLKRTLDGIKQVKSLGGHIRTNTVITVSNLGSLQEICELACNVGVDHINLSNLHPVGSSLISRNSIMPKFAAMKKHVYSAADLVTSRGRVFTLEGFPYCAIRDKTQFQLNNDMRDIRMLMRGQVIDSYDDFMSSVMRVYGKPCNECSVKIQCGGVYPQYIDYNGWGEFSPLHILNGANSVPVPELSANLPA
jgi:MoaA/NifB/PqqE/SkfB family radical SAM enzyme